ncbi:MAG: HEAT repeat domain-containing protein [Planctomycetaceae bacterium]|jgi:precorrin-6B methylase 1|nr:HEAT repeat domain-containing protein [Planctomycetaceae bacterium]
MSDTSSNTKKYNYEKTLELLANSKDRAASRLLDTALRSSSPGIQLLACMRILSLRGTHGLTELIRQFDVFGKPIINFLSEHGDKLTVAIRSALLSEDEHLWKNAYKAVQTMKIIESLPDLLVIYHDYRDKFDNESLLPDLIISLIDELRNRIESRKRYRYLVKVVLADITRVMNEFVHNFKRSDPPLILQTFLELYPLISELSPMLVDAIRNPAHQCYLPIARTLQQSSGDYVFRFVVDCMNAPDPPPLVVTAFTKRNDTPFIRALLCRVANGSVTYDFHDNIKLVKRFDWFDNVSSLLKQLDGQCQRGLVELAVIVPQSRDQRRNIFMTILKNGKPEARLAVIPHLDSVRDESIDELLLKMVDDEDPQIQVEAMQVVKNLKIQNGIFAILRYIDSPHDIVRETVQKLLPEFHFSRFWNMFDQLSDEQRQSSLKLIRKVDARFSIEISEILMTGTDIEKAKALLCIDVNAIAPQIEDALCSLLLTCESPHIRVKIAEYLALGRKEESRNTLVQALHRDTNPDVRAAAKSSLERRPAPWSQAKLGK